MNFKIIFLYAVVLLALFAGQTQGRSKRWRKFEKKFKHAFVKVKEALPVVQGYAGVAAGVAALGKK